MRKIVILLLFLLTISCTNEMDSEYVLMTNGNIENYLFVVNQSSCIIIKFDSREIDKDKLLKILSLSPNMEINVSSDLKNEIINTISEYRDEEELLTQVFINNKKQLQPKVVKIISESLNLDITEFSEKLNKQDVYYFEDIEEIKDSATNLPLWFEQVKQLSVRKDL